MYIIRNGMNYEGESYLYWNSDLQKIISKLKNKKFINLMQDYFDISKLESEGDKINESDTFISKYQLNYEFDISKCKRVFKITKKELSDLIDKKIAELEK